MSYPRPPKGAVLWYIDDGRGCGGVYVLNGRVVAGGAPIFRYMLRQRFEPAKLRQAVRLG